MRDPGTDRRLLDDQYGTDRNLAARFSIYAYADPPTDFRSWALGHVAWRGGERVADVGCGNGSYLPLLAERAGPDGAVVGVDRSPGMAAVAVGAGSAVVGDATALPLPDGAFDVVLAMHMLYHVPDIAAGVSELRRILRPGGTLLAATNGARHQIEIGSVLARVIGITDDPVRGSADRFSLDNGVAFLEATFDVVERDDHPTTLRVPDAEPVVAYIDSARTWWEPVLPAGRSWADCLSDVRTMVGEHIAEHGTFLATAHAGVFVCR